MGTSITSIGDAAFKYCTKIDPTEPGAESLRELQSKVNFRPIGMAQDEPPNARVPDF